MQTTQTATNLAAGNYICTVTSGPRVKTCNITIPSTTTTLTTTIQKKPNVPKGSNTNNTIEVFVNGVKATTANYTFRWSHVKGNVATVDLGVKKLPVIGSAPTSTTYTVMVTDANGCTGTASYVY